MRMKWCVGLLVLVAVVGAGLSWREKSRHAADEPWYQLLAEMEAAGEPMTLEALWALRPEISDEENGALVVERLADKLDEKAWVGFDEKPGILFVSEDRSGGLTFFGVKESTLEQTRSFFETYRATFDSLAAIRNFRRGRLTTVDLSQNITGLWEFCTPTVVPWRHGAQLAQIANLLALADGDTERALLAAEVPFRLASTLQYEPMTVVALVRNKVVRSGIRSLEMTLRVAELEKDVLHEFDRLIQLELTRAVPSHCFYAEWLVTADMFDGMIDGRMPMEDLLGDSAILRKPSRSDIRAAQVIAVQMWRTLIDAGNDAEALLVVSSDVENQIPEMPLSGTAQLARVLHPSTSLFGFVVGWVAELRCVRVGLAAERYRLDRGGFPDSLDALVPDYLTEVPLDPFTRLPVKLTRNALGIVIYSVGRDREDNSGDLIYDKKAYGSPDVGFRLVDVEHRRFPLLDGGDGD